MLSRHMLSTHLCPKLVQCMCAIHPRMQKTNKRSNHLTAACDTAPANTVAQTNIREGNILKYTCSIHYMYLQMHIDRTQMNTYKYRTLDKQKTHELLWCNMINLFDIQLHNTRKCLRISMCALHAR